MKWVCLHCSSNVYHALIGKDWRGRLFSFHSLIVHERPIMFICFQSFKKNYFVRSQNYRSFSIYFARFLTEQLFSKIVCSEKSFVQQNHLFIPFFKRFSKKLFNSFSRFFKIFVKFVRSVKKINKIVHEQSRSSKSF